VQTSHHIITDAQSWVVFVNDLARSYERRIEGIEQAPPAAIQFADYAIWARQLWTPDSHKLQRAVDWWAHSLRHSAPPPPLALAIEPLRRRQRAKANEDGGSEVAWGLDGAVSERLEKLGRNVGASYFSVRFACVVPVLSALTGYRSLPLPVVFTDRTRPVLEGLFGAMANALPVIVDYDPDQSFRGLIEAVQRRLIEQLANGNIPQPLLLAELRKRGLDLPWSYNAVHLTTPVPPAYFAGLTLTWRDAEPYPPVRGLTFLFNELNEQEGCRIAFNPDMYDAASITELASYIVAFVTAAVNEPDTHVGSLVAAAGIPVVAKATARPQIDENQRRGDVALSSGA
jgi:hypothetical protein